MPKLSATIICKNEEDKIRGALESVRFCDELIVVDSHSTDGTLAICREIADVAIDRDWPGYVAQMNFALSQATGDWVLSIDADERVSPQLASEIKKTLETNPPAGGYGICRHTHYLGGWINHGGWYPEYRVRLFKREGARWEGIDPHYDAVAAGPIGRLRGEIVHYTYDDMADHIHTMNRYSSILAQMHNGRGRRFSWHHVVLRPPLEFLRKYVLQLGFMDGSRGFHVAAISAFSTYLKFAKLWELQRVSLDRPWRDEEKRSAQCSAHT